MVEVEQGEIWWADLPETDDSGPAFRRPVVVVQGNTLNRSRISTALCVPLTGNPRWGEAPGSVELSMRHTGLPRNSVANATQLLPLDRRRLTERVAKLPPKQLQQVLTGIDIVLGR
jgi:mRNA interferase MazF